MSIISRFFRSISLVSLLALSCSDHSLIEKGIGARAAVYPEWIDFGHVNIAEELDEFGVILRSETFAVLNSGDENLGIISMQLVDETGNIGAFAITDGDTETPLLPGEIREFTVEFSPQNFESDTALIEIITDAVPQEDGLVSGDYLVVRLEGYGDAPDIRVEPEALDFGNITVDCVENGSIIVRNIGNEDLVIHGIDELISGTFPGNYSVNYGSLPPFPWVIMPEQQVEFWVEFEASDAYENSDSYLDIRVNSNDIDEPEAWLGVDGFNDPRIGHSEAFVAEEIPKADIVFVVDDSGSMLSHQGNLSAQINDFMNTFNTFGVDYHIGVVTTTHSEMTYWIDSTVTDPILELETMVMVGVQGSGMEQGLRTAWECFDYGECGPSGTTGFFRPDAQMVVIFISDEPDHSIEHWSTYKGWFDTIKDPALISMHGIIGDDPSGCTSHPWGAQSGDGYRELIQAYGGSEISICSANWGNDLTNLATTISVPLLYQLSHTNVVESSIEVYVNGQLADPSRWSWDQTRSSVIFDVNEAPNPGDSVTVSYEVASCY
jgi:hypothetical protein